MSKSSNSRSAPTARSTLTASGTTSRPAPSPGTTAMCLGIRRPLPKLVALDLPGQRLGKLGHELDEVRELVALKARLAVLLQLGGQLWRGLDPGDDESLDLHEAVDLDAHDGALPHRPVLQQHPLDLDRRNPQAAHLDHVVGAALVPVEAVTVAAVAVAGEEPVAQQAQLGPHVLAPIERKRTVALHVHVPSLAVGHGLALEAEDL